MSVHGLQLAYVRSFPLDNFPIDIAWPLSPPLSQGRRGKLWPRSPIVICRHNAFRGLSLHYFEGQGSTLHQNQVDGVAIKATFQLA